MARRTKVLTIDAKSGRDAGKSFLITEMDAESAEWWAFRVLQALLGSKGNIDFNAPLAQMARQGLAALGKLPPDQARPLLEELMRCVRVKLPGSNDSRELMPNDIEEVLTRVLLRNEVLELHIDFFVPGGA